MSNQNPKPETPNQQSTQVPQRAPRRDSKNREIVRRTPEQIAQRQAPSQALKAAQAAHAARVRHAAPGPKPGGMLDLVQDPDYARKSAENMRQRRQETQAARTRVGVKTPHRAAGTNSNVAAFDQGRGHQRLSIGTNPNVEARRSRFESKGKKTR